MIIKVDAHGKMNMEDQELGYTLQFQSIGNDEKIETSSISMRQFLFYIIKFAEAH